MNKLKVGIVGSKFAATLHAESYKRSPNVNLHSVAAIDNLDEFAAEYSIKNKYDDYRIMFEKEELDLPVTGMPVKPMQALGLLIEDGLGSLLRRIGRNGKHADVGVKERSLT